MIQMGGISYRQGLQSVLYVGWKCCTPQRFQHLKGSKIVIYTIVSFFIVLALVNGV